MINQNRFIFFNKIMVECEGKQDLSKKMILELFEEFLVTDPCSVFPDEETYKQLCLKSSKFISFQHAMAHYF